MIKLIQAQIIQPDTCLQCDYANMSKDVKTVVVIECDRSIEIFNNERELGCELLGITLEEYREAFPEFCV